jgi:hypothetical protein
MSIPTFPQTPFINPPAPLPIPQPTPASGTIVRRPRFQVYVNGMLMPHCLDITVTRGLDLDLATAQITYPYPLPAWIPKWARVSILMTATDPNPALPYSGLIERFTGYVMTFTNGLWPGTVTINCLDVLALAAWTYTPEEMDIRGDTDVQAIVRILGPGEGDNLGGVGYQLSLLRIDGLHEVIGDMPDANLFWELGQTALEKVKDIDSVSLGFRTYATVGGLIVREQIPTNPNTVTEVHSFREGVDILDGSMSTEQIDPKNEITVSGWDGVEYGAEMPEDMDPFYWRRNSYWVRFMMLQGTAGGAGLLNPTLVAEYILSQLNKNILKVTFSTHLDLLIEGAEVIHVQSPRMDINQKFWVQSCQTQIDANGQFTQTITAVSELGPYNRRVQVPPVEPPDPVPPGTTLPVPPAVPDLPPAADQIRPRMSIQAIDVEKAAPAIDLTNRGQAIFCVLATDQSTSLQGQIVSRVWQASGPGCTVVGPQEGMTFTTFFTDLTPLSLITLTVTDNHGFTAAITQQASTGAVPVRSRKLYAVTDASYEAFDGNVWRTYDPSRPCQVVGNGPWWGSSNVVAYSADDLLTPPTESAVLPPGEDVTAIWVHETNLRVVAVGGSSGTVAVTTDGGAVWTIKPSPGSRVNFIIISIHDQREIHVVTPEGWRKSQDQGLTWETVRAGNFDYLELSHSRNIVIAAGGQLQQGETGTPFTGNSAPIAAATAHIREDKFYAIAEDGTTWYTPVSGSFTLVQGVDIPAGFPYTAGAYRDGQMVDLVYFAAQEAGLFKTVDGFRTEQGYLRLREVGRLTP